MTNVMRMQSHGCENLNCDLQANLFTIGIKVTKVSDIILRSLSPINPILLLSVIPMAAIMLGCDSYTANSRNPFPGARILKEKAAR